MDLFESIVLVLDGNFVNIGEASGSEELIFLELNLVHFLLLFDCLIV